MSRLVRISLSGGEARLGSIPAADVANLLLGAQRALARAMGGVLRRPVKPTGRWGKVVEEAVRFRLVGIEEGSVVGVVELPTVEPESGQFDIEPEAVGEAALGHALRTAAGETDDVDVAKAFMKLLDRVGVGSRYDAVTFETDLPDVPRKVVIDAPARDRLAGLAAAPKPLRADTLVGVLFEADFWTDVSIDELQAESRVEPVGDPAALTASGITVEEAEALLAALGASDDR